MLNVVVIGLGSMGRRRIRLMKAMKLPVNIVGIDSREDRCIAIEKEYGVGCYKAIEQIGKRWEINCAFICTSPLAHADLIEECLNRGYHVFTEINLIADKYKENIALAKEKGLTLFLSSTPIYRDEMRKITQIIRENKKKVSYLYHVGQYLPDWHPWEQYRDFFVGDSRTSGCREIFAIELPWMVKAFGDIQNVHVLSHKLSGLDIHYPDTYLVQMVHENGNMGMLAVDVVCRKSVRKLEIYNEELYIEWGGMPQTLKKQNLHTNILENIECGNYHNESGYSEFINECAYMNEIQEFFDVVKGKEPEYSMEMDEKILRIIDKIENGEN